MREDNKTNSLNLFVAIIIFLITLKYLYILLIRLKGVSLRM